MLFSEESGFSPSQGLLQYRIVVRNPSGPNLLNRLPGNPRSLLRQLGQLADRRGLSIYLVGGVVRDLLLKKRTWDLDVTVEGDGIAFARAVADRYGAGLALFERFGTARLVLPGNLKLDVASTRRESYAEPAQLPDVMPASLDEDLYRRDFTINAMAIQLNSAWWGKLHDPYGGQRDLKAKRIRILHKGSFIDDPTRIFRAVRFAQRFGFEVEPATRRLMREVAATDQVTRLSGPRLCNEILLLCREREPDRSFDQLARLKLFRFLHPDLHYSSIARRATRSLPRACEWWGRHCGRQPIDCALATFIALLGDVEFSTVQGVTDRLSMSKEQVRIVGHAGKQLLAIAEQLSAPSRMQPSAIFTLLHGLSDEALLVCLAMQSGQQSRLRFVRARIRDFVRVYRKVAIELRGDDLLQLGLKAGPQVGAMLRALRAAKLDGVVKGRAGERAFVRARLAGSLSSLE